MGFSRKERFFQNLQGWQNIIQAKSIIQGLYVYRSLNISLINVDFIHSIGIVKSHKISFPSILYPCFGLFFLSFQ